MDKKHEYRVAAGSGVGLTLLAWFAPHVFPDMSTLVTYPAIAIGLVLLLWGIWPPIKDWASSGKGQSEAESFTASFDVALSDATTFGDFEAVCALAITNFESNNLNKCLVQLERMSAPRPFGMPWPLVLRTEGQIRDQRKKRFQLSSGQTKTVPVLLRHPHRPNEWFLHDEHGKRYVVTAESMTLAIAIYGGQHNVAVPIKITVSRPGWRAVCAIESPHEGPAPRKFGGRPEPTVRLEEVVKRILMVEKLPLPIDRGSTEVIHACNAIREKALNGILTVFGGIDWRSTAPADYDRMVRAAIPADFWKNRKIDVVGFLDPQDNYRGFTCDMTGYRGRDDYYGIWFDRDETEATWPR
jgi:hypothetical protein